jgi:hypothetical protein
VKIDDKYLTIGWNNVLTIGFGMPLVAFSYVALATSLMSYRAGFIGIMILGVLY